MSFHRAIRLLSLLLAVLAGAPAQAAPSAPPRRLVIAGRAAVIVADAVYAFPQAAERVVGLPVADQGLGAFLGLLDPGYAAKAVLDRQAGPEAIAALKPDLVLMKSSMAPALARPLAALGIASTGFSLETPADWTRELGQLGEVFGDTARAARLAAYYRDGYAALRARVEKAARPSVLLLYVSALTGDAFNVPPAGWMQTILAEAAGGEPVWKGANPGAGWARVSFEQIAAWNPEHIAVVSYQDDSSRTVARLAADPRFGALAAVKSGRLWAFPQDFYSWDQSGSRWLLGLVWLAGRLHPELFPAGAALEEARRFYDLLYGIGPGRFEASIRPMLKGDYAR